MHATSAIGGQDLERQLDALKAAGCRRVFAEKQSGRDTDRHELAAYLDFMAPGDTLVVPALDRLSRSLQDLITVVSDLRRRGVGFTSLHESLDTTTPGGRLVFHVFAALAEFIRELIVAGARPGTCCPIPRTASPRSPSSSASAPAPSTTTSPTARAAREPDATGIAAGPRPVAGTGGTPTT